MSKTDVFESEFYRVIWRTRRLFQCLGSMANELHRDTEVTASMRAVLEFLWRQEPQTVPQMARGKSVTRQHIQTIVNDLLAVDLIESIENPAHKRSSLIQMTAKGRQGFEQLRRRESRLFAEAAKHFAEKDLKTTTRTLKAIEEYFQSNKWRRAAKKSI